MLRIKSIFFAAIIVAMILPFSSMNYAVAESQSPLKQISNGVLPHDVICYDDKVLVDMNNGRVACVFKETALKTGWKIINTNNLSLGVYFQYEISIEVIEDFINISNIEIESGKDLEIGKWLRQSGYYFAIDNMIIERNETEKFAIDFMNYMDFEFEEENLNYLETPIADKYRFTNEFSSIGFNFIKYVNEEQLEIDFDGWTNHPELVIFPPLEKSTIKKVIALTLELYTYGECDLPIPENLDNIDSYFDNDGIAYSNNYLDENGNPFSNITFGVCYNEMTNSGLGLCTISATINAINQTEIYSGVSCWDG